MSDEGRMVVSPLADVPTPELLAIYGQILTILRERGITRTEDSPVGGYAEYLASIAFGLELTTNSAIGYDGIDAEGIRYQVKGRRITRWNPSRQVSAIRGLGDEHVEPFNLLVGILFNADMSVMRAALVPVAVVRAQSKLQAHVNGWRFHLRDAVWAISGVRDVTDEIREASARAT
ncbi:MAG: hypothetical protein FIA92_11535 [Chloroflexi bacterium]|nr:hypothetical protein [Chloroflexota bacterium]